MKIQILNEKLSNSPPHRRVPGSLWITNGELGQIVLGCTEAGTVSLRPEVLIAAIEAVAEDVSTPVMINPAGNPADQTYAEEE